MLRGGEGGGARATAHASRAAWWGCEGARGSRGGGGSASCGGACGAARRWALAPSLPVRPPPSRARPRGPAAAMGRVKDWLAEHDIEAADFPMALAFHEALALAIAGAAWTGCYYARPARLVAGGVGAATRGVRGAYLLDARACFQARALRRRACRGAACAQQAHECASAHVRACSLTRSRSRVRPRSGSWPCALRRDGRGPSRERDRGCGQGGRRCEEGSGQGV